MSARVEAAAYVLCEQQWENAHERQKDYARDAAVDALAAADQALFSESAIERAAKAAVEHLNERGYAEESEPGYVLVDGTYDMTQLVRAVVAALREGA
jgi:6,7-dimethyl-8-ribityllumazine synthase